MLAGVTRQIGDALLPENSQSSGQVISIGIVPWGIVENSYQLCGHNLKVPVRYGPGHTVYGPYILPNA
jgi:hypothetical protein